MQYHELHEWRLGDLFRNWFFGYFFVYLSKWRIQNFTHFLRFLQHDVPIRPRHRRYWRRSLLNVGRPCVWKLSWRQVFHQHTADVFELSE